MRDRAAFPRVIRLSEVDIAFELTGDATMVAECAAVVEVDGLDRVGQRLHDPDDGIGGRSFRFVLDRGTFHVARLTFHLGDDRTR